MVETLARMKMMATTTSTSIRVKARRAAREAWRTADREEGRRIIGSVPQICRSDLPRYRLPAWQLTNDEKRPIATAGRPGRGRNGARQRTCAACSRARQAECGSVGTA